MDRLAPAVKPRREEEPPSSQLEAELRVATAAVLDRAPSEVDRRILKANFAFWLISA